VVPASVSLEIFVDGSLVPRPGTTCLLDDLLWLRGREPSPDWSF